MSLRFILPFLVLFALTFNVFSQTFEGSITYKLETLNPNPDMIPDSIWNEKMKELFGEDGFSVQKYFYKENYYMSEFESNGQMSNQIFDPSNHLLYNFEQGSSAAMTIDTRKFIDQFENIIELEETIEVLGIECRGIVVNSSMSKMTLWFNSDYLKMDPSYYQEHIYGHWKYIIDHTSCLPLMVETKGMMTHVIQTAMDFEEVDIPESRFDIPKFSEVTASPVN